MADVSLPVCETWEPRRGRQTLAGLDAVGLGGRVAKYFEGVSAVGEILRPVGLEFEFAGADLGAVLFALQFTDTGDEPVGRSGRGAVSGRRGC